MKTLAKVLALLIVWCAAAWFMPQDASAQQASVSFQLFYDELSPYGTWVDHPNHGYVWMPSGDPGFAPYATAGHWVFTDDGLAWFSDYPWGWATFHYGRWDYDDGYGWLWVPDDEWGPAWVSWRSSPGYYGWAPLRPGISISVAFGGGYHERNERWTFVRDGDLTSHDVGRRYVNRSDNTRIIDRSTVVVNTRRDNKRNSTYIAGPDREDFQRITHTTVKPVAVREADRPGHQLNNDELKIYRPQVQKRTGNGRAPAPAKVVKFGDMKPSPKGNADNRQPAANPANVERKEQRPEPREVAPPAAREREQQQQQKPRAVAPPDKVQPPKAREVNPPQAAKVREQQPPAVAPPEKAQPPQARDMNRSNDKGRNEGAQQRAAQPDRSRKARPSQPKSDQEQEDNGKRKR
jgi:hypothetical protein